jgi:hypothetical protein
MFHFSGSQCDQTLLYLNLRMFKIFTVILLLLPGKLFIY